MCRFFLNLKRERMINKQKGVLTYSFAVYIFFRFYFLSMNTWLYSCLILYYVFLLLCLYILFVCLCIFIVSAGTLRLPLLRFSSFFLSFKANARVKPAKTGHGQHSSKTYCVVLCVVCFVLFCVLFVCKCVLYYCQRVATQL
jgi:hypothetical protein